MPIYFYKESCPLGYLASYSDHGFKKEGVLWKTVEHYYQAQKFDDQGVREMIINASTPKEASNIGRSREFNIRDNWEEIKLEVMYQAVLLKFMANPSILEQLMETGDEEIIEETVKENYWGCGPNKDGHNNYGKILCRVRERLR